MGTTTGMLDESIAEIDAAITALDRATEAVLTVARALDAADRAEAGKLLEVAERLGRCGQARHGQLIQILAQVDRVKAVRGGLVPWITTHLDATRGRAQGIAQSARRIGHLPELAEPLSSGRIGDDTIRALTRTARAIKGTDRDQAETLTATLELAQREGVSAANKQVRQLEEIIAPGRAEELLAKQRERAFLRFVEVESGMVRIEGLMDQVRATTLRAAIDLETAACIRERQYDHDDKLPEDVRTVEQIQAHALTRLAEVFLSADANQRGAAFTPPTLYHASLNAPEGELAESVYGELVPRSVLAPQGNSAAHLIEHLDGEPVLLDGKLIDTSPTARLATLTQRTALAYRDRHCTFPGCSRPTTWSLHAHHKISYSAGGVTAVQNLILLCAEHHTDIHRHHG